MMEKQDPENPKLTRNDQEVLKNIILQAKIPDAEIAHKIGVSPQAVFKIRNKLEKIGIIKGYQPIVDFKKIGIRILSMLILKLNPIVWEELSDDLISERIKKIPYVINAYRLPDSNATHILFMGFRNTDQRDKYLLKIQTKFSREVEIINVYSFSVDRVITESPIGLLYEIMNKEEFPLNEFFLHKKKKN